MTSLSAQPHFERESSPLIEGWRVVRERWKIIAITEVVCVVVIMAMSLSAQKKYEATAKLVIQPPAVSNLINPNASNNTDPARDAATALLLIKSSAVAQRAAKAITPAEDPDDLLDQVDVTASPDANVVSVTASDPDPARAAQIADAFANGFVDFRVDQTKEALSEGQKHLQAQLDGLPANSPAASALQQQITLLKELNAATTSTSADAQVFGTAGIPTAPSSPKPKRDFALAIIVGLVLGLAIVFLIDLFDRRIKSADDFETIYRLRSMTSVPQRMTEAATNRDRQAALEPFRILRNSLAYISVKPDIKIVMVTSAVPGEGKSTVSTGLARAAALAGQRVILVECDLRRPTFHQQFDLGGDPRGLTTALIGGVPVAELVRPVHSGLRALTVLPSGPTPPNAAEVFLSAEMRGVLRELSELADLVVLDCPPLLPVADSHVLLDNPQVDACIVVGRAYHTTRDEARRARAVLDQHPLQALGLVINGLRDIDGTYDYYGTPDEPAKPGLVTPRA